MEHVDGGNLSQLMQEHARGLPRRVVVFILRQVLTGLVHLHEHNVIHRDLKPANILMSKDRRTFKIADFGISTEVIEQASVNKKSLAGTPWYMAPEAIWRGEYSLKVDIWSLGCYCYELVVGKRPFYHAKGPEALKLMAHCQNPFEKCDPEVRELFYM